MILPIKSCYWCRKEALFDVWNAKFCCKFFAFLSFLPLKTLKKTISTSIWSAQHPNTGKNIQHSSPDLLILLLPYSNQMEGKFFDIRSYLIFIFWYKFSLIKRRILTRPSSFSFWGWIVLNPGMEYEPFFRSFLESVSVRKTTSMFSSRRRFLSSISLVISPQRIFHVAHFLNLIVFILLRYVWDWFVIWRLYEGTQLGTWRDWRFKIHVWFIYHIFIT